MLGEFHQMIRVFLNGYYPPFVTGNHPGSALPVFYYHRTKPEVFKGQLNYLQKNEYKTLKIKDLILDIKHEHAQERNVVLTFDDGWADLYLVAYPLLKSYRMHGIAFVSPGLIGRPGRISWAQAREMHDSGVVDFQSHTFSHSRIAVSGKIIDFIHPGNQEKWDRYEPDRAISLKQEAWGFPVYENESSLSDRRRFLGNADVEKKSLEFVLKQGGTAFFHQRRWRRRLLGEVSGNVKSADFETLDEQKRRIRSEMERAKASLEKELRGKIVVAFAYPHHAQGEAAARLLRETGHRLVFGGLDPDSGFGTPDREHVYFNRLNSDFLFRLPGKGRKSLLNIMIMKGAKAVKGMQS
jgi:peptidoglycan/xylan/chitin deacetylase (PgdA/CDA1 family)